MVALEQEKGMFSTQCPTGISYFMLCIVEREGMEFHMKLSIVVAEILHSLALNRFRYIFLTCTKFVIFSESTFL